ncbi:MAG: rhaA, partial [Verrucomicrobiales bacterium]|nr:rhaA [Verrucomicrobiales bacterium]
INRIAAWIIGTRCMIKALLIALVEPTAKLRALETAGDHTSRLALLEQCKTLPFGAVYDYYCAKANVPTGAAWLNEVKAYEKSVLSKRA